MNAHRYILVIAGAVATSLISFASIVAHGPAFIAQVEAKAGKARDAAGGKDITLRFTTSQGWLTRHPELDGGADTPRDIRQRTASAIFVSPGVGGVHWNPDPTRMADTKGGPPRTPTLHCQDRVEGILRVRSIRFSEASAAIDPASGALLDEVAAALRPCVGSIIAITGHTDAMGSESANIRLSRDRAESIRKALIRRGIPAAGLRARGEGSGQPLEGLDPSDPANRRIEFSVISIRPLDPTPVDTPSAG